MGWPRHFWSGPWDLESLVERGGRVLGRRYRWLRPLARRVMSAFAAAPRPRMARLAEFLGEDEGLCKAREKQSLRLHFARLPAQVMVPDTGAAGNLAGAGDHDDRRAGQVSRAGVQRT